MSTPTDEPNASYMCDLQQALEKLHDDPSQDAAALRDDLRMALASVNAGWISTITEHLIEMARDVLKGERT